MGVLTLPSTLLMVLADPDPEVPLIMRFSLGNLKQEAVSLGGYVVEPWDPPP